MREIILERLRIFERVTNGRYIIIQLFSRFISEESACCERICCQMNRKLQFKLHAGPTVQAPVILHMDKPFHCP